MLICPKCGQQGIGVLAKLFLGPFSNAYCRKCGAVVSVPRITYLYGALCFLLVYLLGFSIFPNADYRFYFLAGGVIYSIIHVKFVPFITKDR